MSSFSETEDEERFFDSRDDVSSASDCSEGCVIVEGALEYDLWTRKPNSVRERRNIFLKQMMGLSSNRLNTFDVVDQEEEGVCFEDLRRDIGRLMDDGDNAVLANLDFAEEENEPIWKIKNLDNGTEFVLDKQNEDVSLTTLREVSSDKKISLDELQKTYGSSKFVQQLFRKDSDGFLDMTDYKKKSKTNWLHRFSDKTKEFIDKTSLKKGSDDFGGVRVRVQASRKNSKELSAVYTGQEFPAHVGSILTMKFSFDGRHLASAGVDGVVRVWKVLEDDTMNKLNAQDLDAAGLYLWLDHVCKLGPLNAAKEKTTTCSMKSSSRRLSDSDPVVLPFKVFQLSEKPLHEFHGHEGEVLSLSWSKDGSLLSSSVDKTVRLWRVGADHCLRVYSHNNYVTCVEFNPDDNGHFISGSIDGKLRLWEVEGGRVVDWTDIKEIITAVCYCPDGKGGVVGSMNGNCRFYDVIDNRLDLGAQICLKGKKSPGKRITGLQYCQGDVSKVMVTSADSQVRIISGTSIVCKAKGHRSSGTQGPASFTSDGEHLVSVSDDSNVHIWNYSAHDQRSSGNKKIWSCESFFSQNASMAIPWGGSKNKLGALPGCMLGHIHFDGTSLQKLPLPGSFPDCFKTSLGFFLDALSTGSAMWPEEKLTPRSNLAAAVKLNSACKSEFKFLRNAWLSTLNNPHLWGLVIVTAGWDGCIRTFLNYGLPIRF